MDKHPIQTILESVIEEQGEDANIRIYEGYSGRGMYGKECIGVTGSLGDIVSALLEGALKMASTMSRFEKRDLLDDVQNMQRDSMGHDMIVYWPGIEFVGEQEECEDGEVDANCPGCQTCNPLDEASV